MVYCGRPSRGCENCRNLHKRCDEKRPACSRCVKAKRTCLGYRDQSDLVFRDESTRTRVRYRQWHARTSGSEPISSSSASSSSFLAKHPTKMHSNCVTSVGQLSVPAEDAALCHFYHTTLENLSDEDPVHYLHSQLPNLYTQSDPGSPLRLATEAISYAASIKLGQKAALLSRKRYIKAIKAIGNAIQDPSEAGNDQTLYAALLLSGCETALHDPDTPPAWGAHVDGAAAILKFRNATAPHSYLSRGLFGFIRKSALIGHMQICRPMDDIFTVPNGLTSTHQSPEDDLVSRAAEIPDLQHRSNSLFTQPRIISKADVENLLCSARALDRTLGNWVRTIPTTWSYSAALSLSSSLDNQVNAAAFVPYQVHRYQDFYMARVWNFYRVSRLIVQSVLMRAASWLSTCEDPSDVDERGEIKETSTELVNEICASVPFLLGHDLSRIKLPAVASRKSANREEGVSSSSMVKEGGRVHTGRYSLIWPLYVACSSPSVPEAQRQWMRMQLRLLAESGETQAHFACCTSSQILLGRADEVQFDCV